MGSKIINPYLDVVNKDMCIINQYQNTSPPANPNIVVTIAATAGFVAGINLNFGVGNACEHLKIELDKNFIIFCVKISC